MLKRLKYLKHSGYLTFLGTGIQYFSLNWAIVRGIPFVFILDDLYTCPIDAELKQIILFKGSGPSCES